MSRVPTLNRGDQLHLDLEVTVKQNPPVYRPASLPERPPKKPFWRRHLLWLLTIFTLILIFVGTLVGITWHHTSTTQTSMTIPNNTLHSVASSGMFLKDNETWNMQTYWQNSTGGINFQMSLDGKTFQPSRNIALNIAPKIGSPLSATAEVDPITGVVMVCAHLVDESNFPTDDLQLNIFYISGKNNISMSAVTCPANSVNCNTISNCELPTSSAPNEYTGLAAVNVNNAQDWRVYYYDEEGYVSELAGNSSGFDMGTPIGGLALNSSAIAAVNVNSTTNNINLFYVDQLTQELFTMQFTGSWTTRMSLSPIVPVHPTNEASFLGLPTSSPLMEPQIWSRRRLHLRPGPAARLLYRPRLWHLRVLGRVRESAEPHLAGAAEPEPRLGHGGLHRRGYHCCWVCPPRPPALSLTSLITETWLTQCSRWHDQVRFFQVAQGKMVEASLNNMTWSENFVSNVAL